MYAYLMIQGGELVVTVHVIDYTDYNSLLLRQGVQGVHVLHLHKRNLPFAWQVNSMFEFCNAVSSRVARVLIHGSI